MTENHRYTADLYAPLLGEAPFRRLEKWMMDHGYRAYDTYNTQWPDYQLTLCYANPAWGDERPRGGNAYKIKHTGICAQFDAYVDEPVSLGLCIPSGMKPYLAHFDQMPPKVQAFVMERTKKCDGCRYCVQTDKTAAGPWRASRSSTGAKHTGFVRIFRGIAIAGAESTTALSGI